LHSRHTRPMGTRGTNRFDWQHAGPR
jgi:hypothetical protein